MALTETVADLIVATLKQAGVSRMYGVVGDSLNGITDALRRDGTIKWMHTRNEEGAAFAACGEAQVTGRLAVCAGSCSPGNLHLRFNEGACDSAGRFWLGCMCDPPPGDDATGTAPLHRWTSTGGPVKVGHEARCHNGMAWSPGENRFYLSHSMEKVVYCYDFHAPSGRLGPAQVFATLGGKGIPDGAAVDEEGAYWCAHHGADELRRYALDGVLLHTVALPVSRVTMCAFGGHDLRTLFISSASDGLNSAELRQQPLAGALFQFVPGVRGLARPTEAL